MFFFMKIPGLQETSHLTYLVEYLPVIFSLFHIKLCRFVLCVLSRFTGNFTLTLLSFLKIILSLFSIGLYLVYIPGLEDNVLLVPGAPDGLGFLDIITDDSIIQWCHLFEKREKKWEL